MKLVENRSILGGFGEVALVFAGQRQGSNPPFIDDLRSEIVAAFRANPQVERLRRLRAQVAELHKIKELAQAKVEELTARRKQLCLEVPANLAKLLTGLDKEIAEAQERGAEAQRELTVLDQEAIQAEGGLQEMLTKTAKPICQTHADKLLGKRFSLLREIQEAMEGKTSELNDLALALMVLTDPTRHVVSLKTALTAIEN